LTRRRHCPAARRQRLPVRRPTHTGRVAASRWRLAASRSFASRALRAATAGSRGRPRRRSAGGSSASRRRKYLIACIDGSSVTPKKNCFAHLAEQKGSFAATAIGGRASPQP
jgi:hypothetical protein